jgi:hypothetical protein
VDDSIVTFAREFPQAAPGLGPVSSAAPDTRCAQLRKAIKKAKSKAKKRKLRRKLKRLHC